MTVAKESVSKIRAKYAKDGAIARMAQLQIEYQQIARAFPDIAASDVVDVVEPMREEKADTGRRSKWTAKRKREVSERMKKYWARRRFKASAKKAARHERETKTSGKET
jgi:hypothetical protein